MTSSCRHNLGILVGRAWLPCLDSHEQPQGAISRPKGESLILSGTTFRPFNPEPGQRRVPVYGMHLA